VPGLVEGLLYVKKNRSTPFLACRLSLILLIIIWQHCVVEWFSQNWYRGISLLSGTTSSILLRSSLLDTLAIMGRRLMGLYDVNCVGGFPGPDIMTIWASFHWIRKWQKHSMLVYIYCDMLGRMPSLLGNLTLDTPVVARQPKVKHLHGYPHHLSTVELHGCLATVVECFHCDSPMF
jgi:hypothetical protein